MKYNPENQPVSMGNWMLTFLILAIPVLNVVMLFYWAFSSSTNPSKRTYCQAMLMYALLAAGLAALVLIIQAVPK